MNRRLMLDLAWYDKGVERSEANRRRAMRRGTSSWAWASSSRVLDKPQIGSQRKRPSGSDVMEDRHGIGISETL
jgi:hypothetical protein